MLLHLHVEPELGAAIGRCASSKRFSPVHSRLKQWDFFSFSPCWQHVKRQSILERSGPSCQKNEWNRISGHVWEHTSLLMPLWKHVAEPWIKPSSPSGRAQNCNCVTTSSPCSPLLVLVAELAGGKQHNARKQGWGVSEGLRPRGAGDPYAAVLGALSFSHGWWHLGAACSLKVPTPTQWTCQEDDSISFMAALTQHTCKCSISHPF